MISAETRFDYWNWDEGSGLYIDHNGKRVVGAAESSIERTCFAEAEWVQSDDSSWLCFASSGSGFVTNLQGSAPPETLKSAEPFAGQVMGSGWAVVSRECLIDGIRHNFCAELAVPFLLSFEGTAKHLLKASQSVIKIAEFSPNRPDSLKAVNWRVQNGSDIFEFDGQPIQFHLNAAHFEVEVPENAIAIVIRQIQDQFHGRRRARILLNDNLVGWWSEPNENRAQRVCQSIFGIGAQHLKPGSRNTIEIDPPSGAPLWSWGRTEVFCWVM